MHVSEILKLQVKKEVFSKPKPKAKEDTSKSTNKKKEKKKSNRWE